MIYGDNLLDIHVHSSSEYNVCVYNNVIDRLADLEAGLKDNSEYEKWQDEARQVHTVHIHVQYVHVCTFISTVLVHYTYTSMHV